MSLSVGDLTPRLKSFLDPRESTPKGISTGLTVRVGRDGREYAIQNTIRYNTGTMQNVYSALTSLIYQPQPKAEQVAIVTVAIRPHRGIIVCCGTADYGGKNSEVAS